MVIRSLKKAGWTAFFGITILITANSNGQSLNHVPGDLIVMIEQDADVQKLIKELSIFNSTNSEIQIISQLSKRLNIWLLHVNPTAADENEFLDAVKRNTSVVLAQFNHYTELRNTPNDANFGQQWNMLNIGQTGGTSGADVRATSAWDLTTGGLTESGDSIVIAIDDDGFDLAHEDLHYWKNLDEVPGDLIDNDANGYIDDYDGWNAQSNSGTIISSSHGTHVAGIAGARGNNSIGVAGVNWRVLILPVQGNSGIEATAVAGYSYILEMRAIYNETDGGDGAFVISANSSWGVDNGQPSNYPIWCAMYDSMGHYGILNVAATANSTNVDVDVQGDMPTACPSDYLITVTSTDQNDLRKAAYGATTIDLGAPGMNIMSTIPGNQYGLKSGTSMASPHVAGAVGLIASLPCEKLADDLKNDPAATALRIKQFILDGVDPNTDLQGKTVSGGRLNVYQALLNAAAYYDCNVGIDDVTVGHFNIYPNPASDYVIISNLSLNASSVIQFTDMIGRTVLSMSGSQIHDELISLDISTLPTGVYAIQAQDKAEHVLIGKIVK